MLDVALKLLKEITSKNYKAYIVGGFVRDYLMGMIAYSNGETERYQNSMIMFNSNYKEYADWYNRTHKPIQKPLKVF